jgi:hypothetical protein
MRSPLLVLGVVLGCASSPHSATQTPAASHGLAVAFNGQQTAIDKDGFTIGGDGADLATAAGKDCKYTSRVVVKHNDQGAWMIADRDSTGIGFNKMKMDNKVIADGDVFELCGGELRFSLR